MKVPRYFAAPMLLSAMPAAAAETVDTLTYTVEHQLWGKIGTLRREIRKSDKGISVSTDIAIHVSLLGATLRDTHGHWEEVWRDGRLQRFDAKTMSDGKSEIVHGEPEGGAFLIRSGEMRSTAPVSVHPVNPWSLKFVDASVVMSPETGRVFPAVISDKGIETKSVAGETWRLHHYVMDADGEHHLYFDALGTLVCLEFSDLTGKATVSLNGGLAKPSAAVAALASGTNAGAR